MCRVTIGHLRVTIGHPRVTVGHSRLTIGHLRATMGHFRLTSIGYLMATVAHIRVTLGHFVVIISHYFSFYKQTYANTELHSKVRRTCIIITRAILIHRRPVSNFCTSMFQKISHYGWQQQ